MTVKFLDLHAQYLNIKSDVDGAIQAVIRDSAFIGGKYVQCFEENFAAYQQVRHCIGVGNGTDALEIAIVALNLPVGSEIIVPANSFIASSEAVTSSGHKVLFCDCKPGTYTVSIEDAEKRITPKTQAIIAVHLYGHPCDMDSILDFARRHQLKIIEDCAQAHGAEYKGVRVGGIGDIGTFSFYPGKNLGAYGDGGAIVTNDDGLAEACRKIANHGRIEKYNHEFEGRNSRLDGMQAAILGAKLPHLDSWIHHRREVAESYLHRLRDVRGLILPRQEDWARHVWHLFVVLTGQREELKDHLEDNGIQTGIHYPISLPKLKAYSYLDQGDEPMVANTVGNHLLSLPIGEHLTASCIDKVIRNVASFCNNNY